MSVGENSSAARYRAQGLYQTFTRLPLTDGAVVANDVAVIGGKRVQRVALVRG